MAISYCKPMLSKPTLFLSLLLLLLLFPMVGWSLVPQLDYPEIQGLGINIRERIISGDITLTDVARWLYWFFVIMGGVAAFIGLVTGGFKWLTSAGSPGRMSDAKNQIFASFIGLILLLGSWILLHTLDPQLVIFPQFETSAPLEPALRLATEGLTDGFILHTSSDTYPELQASFGDTRIEDTRQISVAGEAVIDLSGQGSADEIERIEFVLPRDTASPVCTAFGTVDFNINLCPFKYDYGVACFERPGFQGRVLIATSVDSLNQCLKIPRGDARTCNDSDIPCGSLLSFRLPIFSIYTPGDQIVFYEYPYPQREEWFPTPTGRRRIILGQCLKFDAVDEPENCAERFQALGHQMSPGGNGVWSLARQYNDPTLGDRWAPLSMEIKTDRAGKYLVFLFQLHDMPSATASRPHWRQGLAYWFQTDVLDFENPQDDRLYWIREPPPALVPFNLSPNTPKTIKIYHVEHVF